MTLVDLQYNEANLANSSVGARSPPSTFCKLESAPASGETDSQFCARALLAIEWWAPTGQHPQC